MDVFDAAERYQTEGRSLIIVAGRDYGSGKSCMCNRLMSVTKCIHFYITWLRSSVTANVNGNSIGVINCLCDRIKS